MVDIKSTGIDIDEIIEILNTVAATTLANWEDDGKLDAKEIILLIKLLVDLSMEAADDEKLKDTLKIIKNVLKVASFFVKGDDID